MTDRWTIDQYRQWQASGTAPSPIAPAAPEPRHIRRDEFELAIQVHELLGLVLPDDALHFAVPNGVVLPILGIAELVALGVPRQAAPRVQEAMRKKGAREIARQKACGLRPGMPDFGIARGGLTGWIELKTEEGRLKPAQREVHSKLAFIEVCRDLRGVERALEHFGIPLRGQAVRR